MKKKLTNTIILAMVIIGLASYTFKFFPVITGLVLLALAGLLIFLEIDR